MTAVSVTEKTGTATDGGVSRAAAVTGWVPAPAGEVMALITNVDRLPEWNVVVRAVVERPAEMAVGAQWVVRIRPPGFPSWLSRSTCVELDRDRHVFAYRTQTVDGNPSWVDWRWEVTDERGGSRVAVSYDLNPRTRPRITVFSRLRHRQLRGTEIPASIAALGRALDAARSGAEQ